MDNKAISIQTVEMHTGGDPLRIVKSGYPDVKGDTILEQRAFAKDNLDHLRRLLIFEPRGHNEMFGALLVQPTVPDVDLAVLFFHKEGYSTMCGHAIIALGRYAIDHGVIIKPTSPETMVRIQCPCGVVTAYTEYDDVTRKTGATRFLSVPAFVFKLDHEISIEEIGVITVDISYGGAFYVIVSQDKLKTNIKSSSKESIISILWEVFESVRQSLDLYHPYDPDLSFLYGAIITDGNDVFSEQPTDNVCLYADKQLCRSPCGSGVTARIAQQFARKKINLGQKRTFENSLTGSRFSGRAVEECKYGDFDAVRVEVSGHGYYTGSASYTVEVEDPLKRGFLIK